MKTVVIKFLDYSWTCIDLSNPYPVINNVTEIPEAYLHEENIDLSNNCISKCYNLPLKLKICNLSCNNLENWISRMEYLIYLDVSVNDFDDLSLHYFPVIEFLLCSNCNLQRLKGYSNTLKYLDCSHNMLTTIPHRLPELIYINCDNRVNIDRKNYPKLKNINN
jgi:Leucine-rich repeat (LRR) protein